MRLRVAMKGRLLDREEQCTCAWVIEPIVAVLKGGVGLCWVPHLRVGLRLGFGFGFGLELELELELELKLELGLKLG
jgi:hypothetical protein